MEFLAGCTCNGTSLWEFFDVMYWFVLCELLEFYWILEICTGSFVVVFDWNARRLKFKRVSELSNFAPLILPIVARIVYQKYQTFFYFC